MFYKNVILTLVCAALAFAVPAYAEEEMVDGYVVSNDGKAVTSTYDDCVRTTRKDSMDKREECGYEQPKPKTVTVEMVETPTAASITVQKEQKVVIGASILFAFDSAELSDDGKAIILERIAALGNPENKAEVSVVGHTDSTGPEAYNQKLSESRAQTVAEFIEQMKESPDTNVEYSGVGESDPVDTNDTKEGRMNNRRVVITVVGKMMK
jgi:OOP family OmpA-OmpF porin